MVKDIGALRPEIHTVSGFIKKEETKAEISDDEKILALGAEQKFWIILRKHFDNSIEQLEQINESAMVQGLPMEEIGRNAIVISQVKGVLRKITNIVEDAHEQMEKGVLDGRGAEK